MPSERGYLLFADITGYTGFVAQTATEVGSRISGGLLETLLQAVVAPFQVANIEGDALFLYATDTGATDSGATDSGATQNAAASGQTVLDAIDALYCAFTDHVCALKFGASCPEDPALLAGALDLKLIVHFGEYALQALGPRRELAGSDVILLHRLAKNDITQQSALSGYAMLTTAAVEQMHLGPFFDSLEQRTDRFEHLGTVNSYVYPLKPMWERRRRSETHYVGRDAPLLVEEMVIDLPVPPCRAWELMTEPQYRMQWIKGVQNIALEELNRGRVAEGTVHYCDHGGGVVIELKVLDWRPFDYLSFEIKTPLGLIVHQTIELQPIGAGTRVAIRVAKPQLGGLLQRWLARTKIDALRDAFLGAHSDTAQVLARLARPSTAHAAI